MWALNELTNDSFFLALGWSRYLDWRESFASDRCCPTLREKLVLTTCNFSLFWRVWNVCLEFDWWGWRPRLQHWHCCSPTFLSHLNCQFIPRICKHLAPELFKKNFKKKSWPNLHKEKLLICTGSSQTGLSSKCSFFWVMGDPRWWLNGP